MKHTIIGSDALDAWTERQWNEGVQVDQLRPLESLSVRTRNNVYELVVTDPSTGAVMVRGGANFPAFTPARVCGSTAGGSLVKRAGIYVGLRLEIAHADRRIITSTVMSIDITAPSQH